MTKFNLLKQHIIRERKYIQNRYNKTKAPEHKAKLAYLTNVENYINEWYSQYLRRRERA